MKSKYIVLASISALLLWACNQQENPLAYQTDTHGRGKAKILIEESFKRLFDTSIHTFECNFPKADIEPVYMAETDIIQSFYNNEAKTIVLSRDFTEKEKQFLKSKKVEVRSDKLAIDGIAIIVNPANKDTLMTVNQLKQILLGEQKKWSALPGDIAVIYDQNNSANYNFLKAYCGNKEMGKNAFAVKSNEEVINYVKKNPNAVGVIGVNWISDQDDFDVVNFLNGIKVVGLSIKEGQEYYQPFAGYIYTKEYPLTREIWIINKGKRSGLNSGFVNFMVGDIGQTIIQKSSIVPARNPIRLIEFKEENM